MYYECCVCKNLRQDATLHHMPRCEKRLNKWLKCLNRASYDFTKLSPTELLKLFICQKHFEKKFITPKSRLIVSAYPSLFTQDEISSGISSQDNTENLDPEADHNYAHRRGDHDHTYSKHESQKAVTVSVEAIPLKEHLQVSITETPVTMEPLPSTSASREHQQQESRSLQRLGQEENAPNQVATCNTAEEPSQATEKETPVTMEPLPSTSAGKEHQQQESRSPQRLGQEEKAPNPVATCNTAEGALQATEKETPVTMEPLPSTSAGKEHQQQESRSPQRLGQEEKAPNPVATCNTAEGALQATEKGLNETMTVKKPKVSRKRLVAKVKDLTPQCRLIYEEFKKSKRQVDFYQRAKRALKFNKTHAFKRLTHGLNPYAKKILKMQINLCTKHKKGRRFTTEEKTIALAIMKQSPKCYRFLQKNFILPSRSTLNKMVDKLKMRTGICPQVFELLKKEIDGWDEKKKMCSLLFDEVSLERGLTYDKNGDTINGLVELKEKKNKYADHALVFMLRGAVYKWQQPIAFYFCEGATNAMELKNILKDVIAAVVGCGLKPIALISDQGSSFRSAIKNMKEETKRKQILANQEPDDTVTISGVVGLRVLFDPPHLIKGLRNNFITKNIKHDDGKISKWSDIVQVYENDNDPTEPRLLHKLNDQHVIPGKIKKMKVKNCVKVFSTTMAAALRYSARYRK